jgi:hypothetical protein
VESGAELVHSRLDALRTSERVPVLNLLALRMLLVLLHLRLRVRKVHFQLRAQASLHFQLIRHLYEIISILMNKTWFGETVFTQKL